MTRRPELVMGISFHGCHLQDTGLFDGPYSLFQDATEKDLQNDGGQAQRITPTRATFIWRYHHDRQDLGAVAEPPS